MYNLLRRSIIIFVHRFPVNRSCYKQKKNLIKLEHIMSDRTEGKVNKGENHSDIIETEKESKERDRIQGITINLNKNKRRSETIIKKK